MFVFDSVKMIMATYDLNDFKIQVYTIGDYKCILRESKIFYWSNKSTKYNFSQSKNVFFIFKMWKNYYYLLAYVRD